MTDRSAVCPAVTLIVRVVSRSSAAEVPTVPTMRPTDAAKPS
ncbi:hypothetical protein [Methylorubrum extorquens]|nr:hypothetical protein [Methylorubrum extorquens]